MGRRATGRTTELIRCPIHLKGQILAFIEQLKTEENIPESCDSAWLGYYGGKQRLAVKIGQLIPSHRIYCEPYCGGAAVLFSKPKISKSNYREVLNDLDSQLIALYRIARDKPKEFYRWLQLTPYSIAEYEKAKIIRKQPWDYSDLEIAWANFVNLEFSYNNSHSNGWAIARYGCVHPQTWQNKIRKLPPSLERLKSVYLECRPAIECIQKWDSCATFFYVDPPYPGTRQGHYSGFSQRDFEELVECLKSIKGKFVLSNYDNPAVPSSWYRQEIAINCSSAFNGSRTEILWMNYEPSLGSLFD